MAEKVDVTYKIILLGDSSVGKTCIFQKITKGEVAEKTISTIGLDRRTLNFKIKDTEKAKEGGQEAEKEIERNIEVQLWDSAGQERYRSITKGYFKASQGLLLVYDITKRETFENISEWINSIKDSLGQNDDYLIILIGNKVDLVTKEPERRDVQLNEAEELCKDKGIYWGGECSALDFTIDQFKEMFNKYIEEIYKKVGLGIAKGQIVEKDNNKKKKKSKC